ncbi:Tetratricopeptide TPR_1 repeat-containing protein [Flexistipes sinusarabici DSM 4947]|uniref:Tetratricopeptide TPR_1 repeat-containing protein n=1 Tax=Flexistipes sinusarabici (strain ATCC 49648 / DSM 4947 / MAS 10) TaxID=717231 RepID=F8E9I3_FLESM|nr:tetratricopeptide repeat protein [Flexistipes sinusarabici]AEI15312.1 Tetratricopeptide TPR_1 repeat-containing protein [Flexistipes sinusarabici DSM 4947]
MKRIALSLLLIFVILGCAAKNDNAFQSHYKMGLAYLNTDKDYMAIREFEKALKYKPNDAKTHYAIATFYLKHNKLLKAQKYLERAIELDPSNSDYHNAYASTLASLGNVEKAVKQWKIVLEDPGYPNHGMIYYNMGYSLYGKGRYDRALEYFKRAVEINPRFISPYMYMYRIYKSWEEHDKAIDILKKALKRNPVFLPAKLELGKYYYNQNKYEQSAKVMEEIIELQPDSEEAKTAASYLKKMGLYYE